MTRNRLGEESSPYLLQHRDNPVHWWAWGPDALAEAKRSGKPILLSVGYSACHWCHVMAHESFEDEPTAAVMNDLFVNIKVDREERPDIDAIYMGALHRLGQQGGWPLTMFLDADARPFWGGTYFPKIGAYGRPAFVDVLARISDIYRREPDKVAGNAEALVQALKERPSGGTGAPITDTLLREITQRLARVVDPIHGGITGAPKFPQWSFFWLLWRGAIRYRHEPAKAAVTRTLNRICQGGIYDHLGGGFARYSVDELWLAPHFEKMLYDNALLLDLMTEVWRETQDPLLEARIDETVGWLAREMVVDGGGFASALDADSEGEEGKFYVWSADEIEEVLGPEKAAPFMRIYDVTAEGNWEGHTILNRLKGEGLASAEKETELATLRAKLLQARSKRIRPGWDDKVLADWNGLMIAALARAGTVFERAPWVTMARKAFTFVEEKMTVTGRLVHSVRDGEGRAPATSGDYANMIWAALRLLQATGDAAYLEKAEQWVKVLDEHYWDAATGGYFTAADDTKDVIVRLKSASDDATPSSNAVMVSNLALLGLITGNQTYHQRAERIVTTFAADISGNLAAHTGVLAASIDLLSPQLVVVVGADDASGRELHRQVLANSIPGAAEFRVSTAGTSSVPVLEGKGLRDGEPAAYVCTGPECSLPLTSGADLARHIATARAIT